MSNILRDAPNLVHENIAPAITELGDISIYPTEIPGITDDELYELASGDIPSEVTWDNLADYGFGVPREDWTLAQLRKRFDYKFYRSLSYSGDAMKEPEKFVKAIWDEERRLPNMAEYAQALGGQELLNPEEVEWAKVVSAIEDLPETERHDKVRTLDEDEKYRYDKVRNILEYFINLQPGALPADSNPRNLAEKYAQKRIQGYSDHKYHDQANKLLLQARGLSEDEAKRMWGHRSTSDSFNANRYRVLGVSPELARTMAENAGGPIFHHFQNPTYLMESALRGNLNTQFAVRKFVGADSLYELLTYQARLDRRYQGNPNLMYRFAGVGLLGTYGEVQNSTFDDQIFTPEESARFKALAHFAVHELALQPYLIHYAKDELMQRYAHWVETEAPQ